MGRDLDPGEGVESRPKPWMGPGAQGTLCASGPWARSAL
jgi:hypothetical protein